MGGGRKGNELVGMYIEGARGDWDETFLVSWGV